MLGIEPKRRLSWMILKTRWVPDESIPILGVNNLPSRMHPEVSEIEIDPTAGLRPLAPGIRTVWTIKSGLGVCFAIFGAIIFDVASYVNGGGPLPLGLLSGVVAVVGIVGCISIPRLRYRYWKYRLRDEELFLERGIFNRVNTIVPLSRIQHLDVSQDIIEREFDLGKLIVHTAGTRSSDVILPGLDIDEAHRLRDEVKHFIKEDAV